MYILDTNIVSEMRKGARMDRNVAAWADSVSAGALFISAVTLLELETGVLLAERRDPTQGAMLRAWLVNKVQPAFAERILPFDAKMATICAALHVPNPRPERDAMIAATARASGFIVVSRNVSDFAGCGVQLMNPFDTQSTERATPR